MIKVELKGLAEFRSVTDSSQAVKAATYRALNRASDGMRTDISKEVRQTFNINKADVDPRIKVKHCRDYDNLLAEVTLAAGPRSALPLIGFKAVSRMNLEGGGSVKMMKGKQGFYSQRMKSRVGQQGVTYKIMRSGGKGFSGKAFIIPGGGGSLQVVVRVGKGKKGIKEKRVISVAAMISSKKQDVLQRIEEAARQRMAVNFKREFEYYKRVAESQGIGGIRANGRGYTI